MSHKRFSPNSLPLTYPPAILLVDGAWGFDDLMNGITNGLDLERVPGADPLAFATGYLSGKVGAVSDDLDDLDYGTGYRLGSGVHRGEVPAPGWDLEFAESLPGIN